MGVEDTEAVARMLAGKIGDLPAECIAEIEDFIDFLVERKAGKAEGRALTEWAMASSAGAFVKVWNNSEDDVYDAL